MGITLHEGWAILTFSDRPAVAGVLRYERVRGDSEPHQWALEVPACHHHMQYTAFIDPASITSVMPCTDVEAVLFMAKPAPLRNRA